MYSIKKSILTLAILSVATIPFTQVSAMGSNSQQAPQAAVQSESYLNGYLLAWQDGQLKTSVGNYPLNDSIEITDLTNSRDRVYGKDGAKPKVQLMFRDKVLIKVTIYN